ncbi:fungal-specific transcription factor domain-containing protein [Mariannaea sp. PMI_226]|nr:fungal-specific transcription factor domain-containing protein [Mariannaea sp. PMI_226]
MSTLSKSRNVCTGCRSRKKKCGGERPACMPCLKRGVLCFYAGAPSQAPPISITPEWPPIPGLDGQLDFDDWISPEPLINHDSSDQLDGPLLNGPDLFMSHGIINDGSAECSPITTSPLENQSQGNTSSSSQNSLGTPPQSSATASRSTPFPPHSQVHELVDLYFEKFYQYIPILHRPTITSKLQSRNYNDSPLLFFSIMAVSASAHPNREIQQSQTEWYNTARSLFSRGINSSDDPLQLVLAANFIIFQSMIATEFSTAWTTLGEAWRIAVAAGYNMQDSSVKVVPHALGPNLCSSWVDMEQCRRAVWTLFILDRGMCFPIGLTHAIDDRQLRINFPISDDQFQRTVEPSSSSSKDSIQYTSNLDRLITLVQDKSRKKTATLLQFIILAYVFLGRVSERIYALDYEFEEQKPYIDALTSTLPRIRLMLPRSATDLSAADYRDFPYVVWLSAIMSVSTILLHHRPLHDGETHEQLTELSTNWPHCVSVARSTAAVIRDASRSSTDFVINPHLSSSLFTCGRIIVMEYVCPSLPQRPSRADSASPLQRDAALRDDLQVLVFTFERMKEALKLVGRKFRNGLVFYLKDEPACILESKAGGSKGLLGTCDKWRYVDNEDADIPFPEYI